MADVVNRLGIPKHRISYALERGFLKPPQMLHGRRLFSEKDLRRMQAFFSRRTKQ
jgi:DNA-binding transcriptional MerR regulator